MPKQILETKMVQARCEHSCHNRECGRRIKRGDFYQRVKFTENDGRFTDKYCKACAEAREETLTACRPRADR